MDAFRKVISDSVISYMSINKYFHISSYILIYFAYLTALCIMTKISNIKKSKYDKKALILHLILKQNKFR